jgi:hypothetical protein
MSTNSNYNRIQTSRMMRGDGGHATPAPTPLGIPELVSPINGQHFIPFPRKLTMVWKPVPYANGYVVTVQFYSNTPQGKTWLTKPAYNAASTSLTVDFPCNVPGRWCVHAIDSTGAHTPSLDSGWGTFDFTVLVLATPVLVSPLNDQVFANYPRKTVLVWQPVSGATGYYLTVDACTSPAPINANSVWQNVVKGTVQGTSFTFDFVGAQPGRWNVMAIDSTDDHQQSEVSAWSNFAYKI